MYTEIFIVVLLLSLSPSFAEQTNKLARRNRMIPKIPFASTSSVIESEQQNKKNSNDGNNKQITSSEKLAHVDDSNYPIARIFRSSLGTLKDEIEDIFDAVVLAESTEERIEAVIEAALRHKMILGTCAAIPVMRNVLLRERAQRAGIELAMKSRAAEISKWSLIKLKKEIA